MPPQPVSAPVPQAFPASRTEGPSQEQDPLPNPRISSFGSQVWAPLSPRYAGGAPMPPVVMPAQQEAATGDGSFLSS